MSTLSQESRQASNSDRSEELRIRGFINDLASESGWRREKARAALVKIGSPTVAYLVPALSDARERVRWEVAKVLSEISDPAAIPALVSALEDPSFGVRWLASEGLIAAGPASLRPLLEALIHHSDSPWLREGAHHVLRTLATGTGLHLYGTLAPVLKALDHLEAIIEVPPAADRALRDLQRTG